MKGGAALSYSYIKKPADAIPRVTCLMVEAIIVTGAVFSKSLASFIGEIRRTASGWDDLRGKESKFRNIHVLYIYHTGK